MSFALRDYQDEAVARLFNYFETHREGNPLIAMPTGTGKAVVIADFLKKTFERYGRQKILIPTHVQELVGQNYDKFLTHWPQAPAGINSEGLKRREYLQSAIFCSIQSVHKDAALFGKTNLVVVDEAHLVAPSDNSRYRSFIDSLLKINPRVRTIGLTATKWRMGQGLLTEGDNRLFTDICYDVTGLHPFNRFISEGYLSPLVPKKTSTFIDTDGIPMEQGDFKQSLLKAAADKDEITRAAIQETMDVAGNRKAWLVFATGVEHCEHISHYLNLYGVSNVVVHSKLKGNQARENIQKWIRGEVTAAINFNVLTTGIDYPGIDLIVMLRPTQSASLWVQMLGRGTRPVYFPGYDLSIREGRLMAIMAGPKQNCLVLDFGKNCKRLGPINDPVIPKQKGKKPGEAPIKECPLCETYHHPTVKVCGTLLEGGMICPHVFTFEVKIVQSASTEKMIINDIPIMDVFKVKMITYQQAIGKSTFPMLKIDYWCGAPLPFTSYVCFEHPDDNYARRKAIQWWRERSIDPMVPKKVGEVIQRTGELAVPTHIRVHTNTKYPDIKAYCYDGTAFGKQDKSLSDKPEVTTIGAVDFGKIKPSNDQYDDDIPF